MTTDDTNAQKRTARNSDPRPKCIFIGEDGEGDCHFYMTHVEAVVVISSDGDPIWREELGTTSVEKWVDHIGDRRGWERQRLYADMTKWMVEQAAKLA